VILFVLGGFLVGTRRWQPVSSISGGTYLFLILSGLAAGASWFCYFRALKPGDAARVAPLDKLSVVLVAMFGTLFLGEKLTMPNWIGSALIASGGSRRLQVLNPITDCCSACALSWHLGRLGSIAALMVSLPRL
jgi:uncharacterized membrane protein